MIDTNKFPLYKPINPKWKSAAKYTAGEFRITLDKKAFEEDYINYEYKKEDNTYTLVESTEEEKQRKRTELYEHKTRTDSPTREQNIG